MNLTRRDFLIKSSQLIATISLGGFSRIGQAVYANNDAATLPVKSPTLVVVQLSGGNDGLNTVIPYTNGRYYDARPTLRYKQEEVLPLNNQIGLHPCLRNLQFMFQDGKLAIVQGVGYPKPDLSHFRSMEIWQTGVPESIATTGWLGRYITSSSADHHLPAIQIGAGTVNKAFISPGSDVPVVQSLETFRAFTSSTPDAYQKNLIKSALNIYQTHSQNDYLQVVSQRGLSAFNNLEAIKSIVSSYVKKADYPNTQFSQDLQLTAKLISGKAGTQIYYLQLGGFDDHVQEKQQHKETLKTLDDGLGAFFKDLKENGTHNDVIIMVFSEFGRRLRENSSGGTDHGTAAPVFIIGERVKGGLYGSHPNLTTLINGDLKCEVDFRSIYHTIIDKWLHGDATNTLGGTFENLPFI
ncbi:DUF1501 domain-containing protein [Paenibacillus hexagrammi]|uniref:DUF1501 domain-containing protein n=1 Tax=Paenibacillus hexagrammi TaxID=2908839 RepID=A0ABY3SLH6_9BACL|nr:DUF1501 domain-containing protein [Paenibacillus sp. YPD9-1]UJF34333.1 DUF1501 domain-containing protein [Paenibacillus sp. YPD9-1]